MTTTEFDKLSLEQKRAYCDKLTLQNNINWAISKGRDTTTFQGQRFSIESARALLASM